MTGYLGRNALMASAAIVCAMCAAPAAAQTRSFDIPAQAASSGIPALARQANIQIFAARKETRGKRTNRVSGDLTVEQALEALLRGTGLTARRTSGQTFAIVAAPKVAAEPGRAQIARNGTVSEALSIDDSGDGEIVVTGTNIRGQAPIGAPLITYKRKDIERTGAGTVDQLIRLIPQNFGNVDPNGSSTLARLGGDAAGNDMSGSSINLRGLGNQATLILMDGRRMAPANSSGSVVDVSLIPLAAIERVELLTDGASAIYGSDAIGGVANFILRKDFEGAETRVRLGTATQGGGEEFAASQLLGTNWRTGRALISYDYSSQNSYTVGQRSFIALKPSDRLHGDHALQPRQRTHAAMVSASQDLGSNTRIRATATFADRNVQTLAHARFAEKDIKETTTRQYSADFGILHDLSDTWTIELDGSIFRARSYAFNEIRDETTDEILDNFEDTSTGLVKSADIYLRGDLISIPSGVAKIAIGGSVRHEKINASRVGSRSVKSGFGEVSIPVFNGRYGSLMLAAAARYDDYSDFGSTTNPKIGIEWKINDYLALRGTLGTSFKAPELRYQAETFPVVYLWRVPDPKNSTGTTVLFYSGDNYDHLKPERATVFTAGIDLAPVKNMKVGITFHHTEFREKIGPPPFIGLDTVLQQPELVEFVARNPSSAEIMSIINRTQAAGGIYAPFGGARPVDVTALFNMSTTNVSKVVYSGIDVLANYSTRMLGGSLSLSVNAAYSIKNNLFATDAAEPVSQKNKPYYPADTRIRGSISWSKGGAFANASVNYTGGYRNTYLIESPKIRPWTTFDINVGYEFPESAPGALKGLKGSISVLNLFDRDPPRVVNPTRLVGFEYDPANADIKGRFIALQISKGW